MTAQPAPQHPDSGFLSRMDFRRRLRELRELADSEGIMLPLPAEWIVGLEKAGIVVDLRTGQWAYADSVAYMPTDKTLEALDATQPPTQDAGSAA